MKRSSKIAFALLAAGLAATPALASIVVLGDSPGRACYLSARALIGTQDALSGCTSALVAGKMNHDDTVATYVNRGIVRMALHDPATAIADFDRAIAMKPGLGEPYLNKGTAYLRMGADRREAIALFDEAIERKLRRPELGYFGRAIAHELSGDVRAAYRDYRRAQEMAPNWSQPAEELSRFEVRRASGAY